MKLTSLKDIIEELMKKYENKPPRIGYRDPNMSLVADRKPNEMMKSGAYWIWYIK